MIYTEYWNLDFPPFADDFRLEAYVPTRSSTQVVGRIRYALGSGHGAAGVYGAAGVGKTLALKMILSEFEEANWLVRYLPNPCSSARDLLALFDPGLAAALPPGSSGMAALVAFLQAQAEISRPILLAVDDIQATRNTDFLELLRTLLNVEGGGRRALSLLLAGQPDMENRLAAASGFNSQLAVKAIISPMEEEEAKLYILARLKAAGSRQGLFTRQAAELVVELTRGVPRQINRLCELSLVIAFGLEVKKVDPAIVEMAAADLDLLPPEDAPFFNWSPLAKRKRPALPETPPDEEPPEEDILASLAVEAGTGGESKKA